MNEIEKGTTAYFIERIASLEAQVRQLKEEAATADEMYDAQYKKFEDCPHSFGGDTRYLCACSFDNKSDVCAVHAPQLKEALAQVQTLRNALDMFTNAAQSWHDFHNHSEINCDALCACIAPARAALAATQPEP